ncbi:MAG: VacJ family lipoprotein [Candidimonas sp.]|nr:MAG: VacJ family lipoprotein [Candidimonas sp.]TAM23107.1 MAG: VacJ family lipoprotein [Candidimonas sp.]TAM77148.1 MAG: VacJ family lipoprotein [Candidimonas sp.]
MKSIALPAPAKRFARLAPVLAIAAIAAGCASVPNPNPADPWESYNRSMYQFNDTVDRALLKPIASGYAQLTPKPAQTCIHNMFNNVFDVWSAFNSFIQGRGVDFINTLGRVLFNSTMGLGGCIDVASMNGSTRIVNDFGVTLGVWGLKSGPYVVLPFLGPSSLRDGAGRAVDIFGGAATDMSITAITNIPLRNSLVGMGIIDARANLLSADKLVNELALDRYSFIRDAYLQRRKSLVKGHEVQMNGAPDQPEETLPDYSDDTAIPMPAKKAGQ